MAKKNVREQVTLECTVCKNRNYTTKKNKKLHPERDSATITPTTAWPRVLTFRGATVNTFLLVIFPLGLVILTLATTMCSKSHPDGED